jgi:hypothetical protein
MHLTKLPKEIAYAPDVARAFATWRYLTAVPVFQDKTRLGIVVLAIASTTLLAMVLS